jgi:DNA polymerase-3 subunit delta'
VVQQVITFNDIFGQDRAVDALRRAYLADRLPHGLIFVGPAGVGKATTARALAGLFLCEHPKEDMPCGKCPSCAVFGTGNHPDYHVITKELIRVHDETGKSKGIDLSIKVIRPELIEPAGRKATLGRGKVFVVEQAELMNAQAQNAMLKTLEEPAGRTLIVLLADQLGSLLPTIRSRCQPIRFASLEADLVARELEKRGIGRAEAADAARFAEGSLGMAIQWLEDGVVARARELEGMLEASVSGRGSGELPEWLKRAAEEYAERQLKRDPLSSKDQATREAIGLYLHLAAHQFRRRLSEAGDGQEMEALCGAIDAAARSERYLNANVNIALIFQQFQATLEDLFVRTA